MNMMKLSVVLRLCSLSLTSQVPEELLQFWVQQWVRQTPELSGTPGWKNKSAITLALRPLMVPVDLCLPGLHRPQRWQFMAFQGEAGALSLQTATELWLIFPNSCLASCPFLAFTACSDSQLQRKKLLQNNGFCLGYWLLSFFCVEGATVSRLFPSCSWLIEFSFRVFVNCSSFSDGPHFLPTHSHCFFEFFSS
jgi:hypothetical protein